MIKSITKLIRVMALLTTQTAIAGPMSEARDRVKSSLKLAYGDAQVLVENDREQALQDAMQPFMNFPSVMALRKHLLTEQQQLSQGFENIADINLTKLKHLRSLTRKVYNEYGDFARERFDASFISAEAAYSLNTALHLTTRALANFENRCQVGHSHADFSSVPVFFKSLPEGQYFAEIYFNSGSFDPNPNNTADYPHSQSSLGGNGEPTHPEMGGLYSGSPTEKNLAIGSKFSLSTASISYSIVSAGAASSSVTAIAAAVAPWALGIGVGLGVASFVISKQDELNISRQLADANDYLLTHMASDKDVAADYRNICRADSSRFEQIRETLLKMESNQKFAAHEVQMANAQAPKLNIWLGEIMHLIQLEQIKDPTKKIKAKTKELEQTVADEATTQFVTLYLVRVYSKTLVSMNQYLRTISWQSINHVQARAFYKLLRLMNMLQNQLNRRAWSQSGPLMREVKIESKFYKLQAKFKRVLAAQIREIFGREGHARVLVAQNSLFSQVKAMDQKYAYIPAVSELFESTLALVGR